MIRKILLYLNTIRHLKAEQMIGQIRQRIKSVLPAGKILQDPGAMYSPQALDLFTVQRNCVVDPDRNEFMFLNQTTAFPDGIDWNYRDKGKLWNYHLQYAYFLHDDKADYRKKKSWLTELSNKIETGSLPLEPFPVSIRLVQILGFLSAHPEKDEIILRMVRMQSHWLRSHLEKHIDANHLLINRISLALCSLCCDWKDQRQFQLDLLDELDRQILTDGAHYERSPMYQLEILGLLLSLYSAHLIRESDYRESLKKYISLMASWLIAMSHEDSILPLFQDSTGDLSAFWIKLRKALSEFDIPMNDIPLDHSGYRKWTTGKECFWINAGNITPAHQPGHAHGDMMHFIWYSGHLPVIQDRAVSTYEECPLRLQEKSTASHNTVLVSGKEQSEMWSSFRVGRRANIKILEDGDKHIKAVVESPVCKPCLHKRSFSLLSGKMQIVDEVSLCSAKCLHIAYFHLDHHWAKHEIKIENTRCSFAGYSLDFSHATAIFTEEYTQALDFNLRAESVRIAVHFYDELTTTIQWHD